MTKFGTCKILVVGDLMLDEYLCGEVSRISPEAPVPIITGLKGTYTLGGAANVANNISALGANVFVSSVVGDDYESSKLIELLNHSGINYDGIIYEANRNTTKKTRIVEGNHHLLRIDRETTGSISKESEAGLYNYLKSNIEQFDVIIVSDYGKGVLTDLILSSVISLSKESNIDTIVDPKGIDLNKYAGATIITPNHNEALLSVGIESSRPNSVFEAGRRLIDDIPINKVLITCGKDGMVLFSFGEEPLKITSVAQQVFDVSGAGDTVVGVLGLGIASGMTFIRSAELANRAAGVVVSKSGTATVSIEELYYG